MKPQPRVSFILSSFGWSRKARSPARATLSPVRRASRRALVEVFGSVSVWAGLYVCLGQNEVDGPGLAQA